MLSKESALSDLDCVDRLLAMITPILKDPPNEEGGDGDAAMQVHGSAQQCAMCERGYRALSGMGVSCLPSCFAGTASFCLSLVAVVVKFFLCCSKR